MKMNEIVTSDLAGSEDLTSEDLLICEKCAFFHGLYDKSIENPENFKICKICKINNDGESS